MAEVKFCDADEKNWNCVEFKEEFNHPAGVTTIRIRKAFI